MNKRERQYHERHKYRKWLAKSIWGAAPYRPIQNKYVKYDPVTGKVGQALNK